jgi:hypothetical protein
VAEHGGAVSPDGMQRLLHTADWDVDGVRQVGCSSPMTPGSSRRPAARPGCSGSTPAPPAEPGVVGAVSTPLANGAGSRRGALPRALVILIGAAAAAVVVVAGVQATPNLRR